MGRYLYRGFGVGTYASVAAALTPRTPGSFTHVFVRDGSIRYDRSATHGTSTRNAVLRHQLNQAGLTTAGISTTPHRNRAIFYALGGGRHAEGIILTIDREYLSRCDIVEHVVSMTVTSPSVPDDDEVILVTRTGGALPLAIIISQEKVCAQHLSELNSQSVSKEA
jgi:hypothetical protein